MLTMYVYTYTCIIVVELPSYVAIIAEYIFMWKLALKLKSDYFT